jgi:hypothetical protein
LAATVVSASQIDLLWTDSTGETGYLVERSFDGVSGWTDISGPLAVDSTSYSDTGLAALTTYYYRVSAFSNGGSVNSNIDSATTNATPSSYDSWEAANGISGSGRGTDVDGDGFNNEFEYFFGLDPNSSANARMPAAGISTVYPSITYTYRTDDPAVTYTVQRSYDLSGWTNVNGSVVNISGPTSNGDGTSTVTVRSDVDFSTESKQFFRIKATE